MTVVLKYSVFKNDLENHTSSCCAVVIPNNVFFKITPNFGTFIPGPNHDLQYKRGLSVFSIANAGMRTNTMYHLFYDCYKYSAKEMTLETFHHFVVLFVAVPNVTFFKSTPNFG
jgi:hypothetical protein